MKRYFMLILIMLMVAAVSITCTQESAPTKSDIPVYGEERVITILSEQLQGDWWATPIYPVENWSASYSSDHWWLVRAYNVDDSYMGTWSVNELSKVTKPYDKAAENPTYLRPPLPDWVQTPTGYLPPSKETLIMTVEQHIANLSYQEAKEKNLQDTWQAIRMYYPIEWEITYTDTTWILTGIECRAEFNGYTREIDCYYVFTTPSW